MNYSAVVMSEFMTTEKPGLTTWRVESRVFLYFPKRAESSSADRQQPSLCSRAWRFTTFVSVIWNLLLELWKAPAVRQTPTFHKSSQRL